MKRSLLIATTVLAIPAFAQVIAPFTADSYRLDPSKYLDKEITLAVAYVMPSEHPREDGMQELRANTFNMNQFGGHIPIVAPPEVAQRVAAQCGTQHVWNHSHVTFI